MQCERGQRQKSAAHARHEKTRKLKIFAAKRADELFKKDPTARIGDVATDIAGKLEGKHTVRKIKGWLNEAEKKGLLIIPPEARKPGAPEK